MQMPLQGTCQPSVKKSFFFGGSFGSFCSFTFAAVAFGADLEVTAFGWTFNKILVIIAVFLPQLTIKISYRVSRRLRLFHFLIVPDEGGPHMRYKQQVDLVQHVTFEDMVHDFMSGQLRRVHQELKGEFQAGVHLPSPRLPLAFLPPFLQVQNNYCYSKMREMLTKPQSRSYLSNLKAHYLCLASLYISRILATTGIFARISLLAARFRSVAI